MLSITRNFNNMEDNDLIGNIKNLPLDTTMQKSEELENLLAFIVDTLSKELPTLTIDLNYFILGVFSQKKNKLYNRLNNMLLSSAMEAIYESFYTVVSSSALSAIKSNRKIIFDGTFQATLNDAEKEAKDMGDSEITSEHLFLAILSDTDEKNKIRKVFNKAGITYGILKDKMINDSKIPLELYDNNDKKEKKSVPRIPQGVKIINFESAEQAKSFMDSIGGKSQFSGQDNLIPGMNKKPSGKNGNIKAYCNDLNELAEKGKIEPLIGRNKEINEIIRILGRKKKNNAILVGGEGVGKTAIGESLAYKIVHEDVPDFLIGKRLVSLDMTALMAGTSLRGMFEERVKGILDEIKADPSFILFMDNIGAIFADKGKNDFEFSAMIARSLENGEVQVIGTSDFASYRKTFDKDPSLARRFQKIIIEAPTIEESLDILRGIKFSYEEFHKVKYDDKAVDLCVNLANKYITEKNLPDSAIDILDEAGSYFGRITENDNLKYLRKQIKSLNNIFKGLVANNDYEEADKISVNLKSLKKKYNEEKDIEEKKRNSNPITITEDNILSIVSEKTGIPVNNLNSDDKKKLVNMNDRLKSEIIGQDDAIDTVCRALKRNRVGLHKHGCMFSCMSIGKTGTGKTLLAKKLAKELFGDENALVRFDMSEYSDKVAVNKLIGSNPGYVGYEEGGQLTESIKNKKHCVLLLDEIEKADPEIYNVFLQVLDEGFLTDNSGMKVDFKNVIVMFTSNIGAKSASDFGNGIGFNEDVSKNTKNILTKQLKNKFPPEFLNRIDDIIYFNPLTDDNLKEIINLELSKVKKNLNEIGYDMECSDCVIEHILNIVKEEKEFGARPIMRAIQNVIEDKITDAILENNYENGYYFKISCGSDSKELVVS